MKFRDFSSEVVKWRTCGGGKAEPMMAAPPAHIVAKGKREAIEVVKRTLAPVGARSDRSRNSVGVWLGQDNGLKELQVASLPGDGGLERQVR